MRKNRTTAEVWTVAVSASSAYSLRGTRLNLRCFEEMVLISSAIVFAIVTVSQASPLIKRQKSSLKPSDVELLNYALVLEQLQYTFYNQGLANYTKQDFKAANLPSSVYTDFSVILSDEKSHVSYYEQSLQSQ